MKNLTVHFILFLIHIPDVKVSNVMISKGFIVLFYLYFRLAMERSKFAEGTRTRAADFEPGCQLVLERHHKRLWREKVTFFCC